MAGPAPETPRGADKAPHVSADDARGGEVILRRKWERIVFLVGLIGALILGLVLCFVAWR